MIFDKILFSFVIDPFIGGGAIRLAEAECLAFR
jgi:hypothetical protein